MTRPMLGDADGLLLAAERLTRVADALGTAGTRVAGGSTRARGTWSGAAATAFDGSATAAVGRVASARRQLRDVAGQLRRYGAGLRRWQDEARILRRRQEEPRSQLAHLAGAGPASQAAGEAARHELVVLERRLDDVEEQADRALTLLRRALPLAPQPPWRWMKTGPPTRVPLAPQPPWRWMKTGPVRQAASMPRR